MHSRLEREEDHPLLAEERRVLPYILPGAVQPEIKFNRAARPGKVPITMQSRDCVNGIHLDYKAYNSLYANVPLRSTLPAGAVVPRLRAIVVLL
jgi:hypothetical protein